MIGYFSVNSLDRGDKLTSLLLGMVYLEVSQQQRQLTMRKHMCRPESEKVRPSSDSTNCLQQVSRRFSKKKHVRLREIVYEGTVPRGDN